MDKVSPIVYYIKKYPLVRTCILLLALFVFFFLFITVKKGRQEKPAINEILPRLGNAGDIITIKGSGFGVSKDTSYIIFSNTRLTNASIIEWSDKKIKVALPPGIPSGLVYVSVKRAVSNSLFFASSVTPPVLLEKKTTSDFPYIEKITLAEGAENEGLLIPGSIVEIKGHSFTSSPSSNYIYFSIDREGKKAEEGEEEEEIKLKSINSTLTEGEAKALLLNQEKINSLLTFSAQNSFNPSYIQVEGVDCLLWQDDKIIVRLPPSAKSGEVFISVNNKLSNKKHLLFNTNIGSVCYKNPKIYVIKTACTYSFNNKSAAQSLNLLFRFPSPSSLLSQPIVKYLESNIEPFLQDYEGTLIQKAFYPKVKSTEETRGGFENSYVVLSYETKYTGGEDSFTFLDYKKYLDLSTYEEAIKKIPDLTLQESNIKKYEKEVEKLVARIKKEVSSKENSKKILSSPTLYTKEVYDYFIKNFTLSDKTNIGRGLIEEYDAAVLFNYVIKSIGVPAVFHSGIIINEDLTTACHWWNECYILGVGYVPIDVTDKTLPFGFLPAGYITFTTDYNTINATIAGAKTSSKSKTFAAQSHWEECGTEGLIYKTSWTTPYILGVY